MLVAEGGVRQEVAGHLIDGELIEGLVAVEGSDDPIAPGPHLLFGVYLIAVCVGVASGIEPIDGHAFAIAGRGEEATDGLLKGVGSAIGEEGIHLGGCGGEAGNVEGSAAQQSFFRGERNWRE